MSFSVCYLIIAIITLLLFYCNAQESDRISSLPGQPESPTVSQFSGYVAVNKEKGSSLFYWFFEAQNEPSKKPLLLWLNGGPGCSSIGYGAAVELGPLRVKKYGTGLEFNKYAWNKEANLLFLESPVGVGFSYTNTTSELSGLQDQFVGSPSSLHFYLLLLFLEYSFSFMQMSDLRLRFLSLITQSMMKLAKDAYSFLVNWFKKFPQYQANNFYIAGESYAGHYVPQLAEVIYDRNKAREKYPHINFKGFIVGNPETNDYYDYKGIVEYAWSHTVISDQLYDHIKAVCNFRLSNWSDECNTAMTNLFHEYNKIDIYNIYMPKCNSSQEKSNKFAEKNLMKRMRIFAGYDPCFSDFAEEYFNRDDVKNAFHATVSGKTGGRWKVCNDDILNTYNFTVFSTLPIYSKLIKAGLKIWLYSGDADGRVPVIGSRYCVEALNLPLVRKWQTWYHNKQVGGRFVEYEGLTMVTIRGAGHLVPLNKPQESLLLINSFLSGQTMPV